jgi:peptide/nickel transport system substrate-binding protein
LFSSGVAGLLRQAGAAGPGERVQIEYTFPAGRNDMTELARMTSLGLGEVGVEVKSNILEFGAFLSKTIGEHGAHTSHLKWSGSPERLDPSFFLTEFYHSRYANKGGRNYQHYRNPEYDRVCDAQNSEMDTKKRVPLVHKCQEISARDYALWPVGFPVFFSVCNTEAWANPVVSWGNPVGSDIDFWTWFSLKPKTKRTKPVTCAPESLVSLSLGTRSGDARAFIRLINDTFLKIGPKGNVVPWAAESWKVVNNTTVDIVMRKGMKFHDGKPVTMEDVKFTFDYMKERKLAMYKSVYENIDKTEILSGNTFRFHLIKPHAPFLTTSLVYAHILPKHIWENISDPDQNPNENPIGNGPFKFGHWNRAQDEVYLEANKAHFHPPTIDGLYRLTITSREATVAALENKKVDFHLEPFAAETAKELAKLPHLTIIKVPDFGAYEIRGDLDRKPFNDIAFRQAVSHLIPRKDFMTLIYEKDALPAANSLIHPDLKPWYNDKVPFDEYSVEKAKAVLKKAGYSWDSNAFLHYPG